MNDAEKDLPTEFQMGDEDEADIRPTDIVFDCPHCGHNLAIDYRGAGLQTRCVECGEMIQVPIPDGMKLDDLDLSAGELLVQLFQTRRMLLERDARIKALEEMLESTKLRRSELEEEHRDLSKRETVALSTLQACLALQDDLRGKLDELVASFAPNTPAE